MSRRPEAANVDPQGPQGGPEVRTARGQTPQRRRRQTLQTPGRSQTQYFPQHQTQIETGCVNEQSFQNIGVLTQMRPTHPTRVITVRETPLHQLAATTHQPLAALTPNPTTIAIYRPRLHVHRVLGLVGQVRAAVLHLRDLRIPIVGMSGRRSSPRLTANILFVERLR